MNKKNGRPSKFDTINQEQLKKLVISGWDDSQVSDFFGFTEQSFNNYKIAHPKFFESLKDWKLEADLKVERSLYQRAIGYEYEEVTREPKKSLEGQTGDLVITKTVTKQIIPDVIAQIFWLKNRKKDQWRDKTESEVNVNFSAKTIMDSVREASKSRIKEHV